MPLLERSYAFAGTTMTILVGGEQTGGAFTILHVNKPLASSTPPHSHDDETEVVYLWPDWSAWRRRGKYASSALEKQSCYRQGGRTACSTTARRLPANSSCAPLPGSTASSPQPGPPSRADPIPFP